MRILVKYKTLFEKYFIVFVEIIYFILASYMLDLPGLYMDSVNPDYMALHILRPELTPAWLYPDNVLEWFLHGHGYQYPILNSLYGIATPAYIYLIWGMLIGFNVTSVRLLHVIYGAIIIFFFYKLICAIYCNKEKRLSFYILVLLFAINPTMIFVWRTQYYLQLFPMISFLPALYLLYSVINNSENNIIKLIVANILFGFSAAGYFVYAIYYIPIFVFECVLLFKKIRKTITSVLVPFIIGFFPYLYGHISIILISGIDGWINSLKGLTTAYGLGTNTGSRLTHVINQVLCLFSGKNEIHVMTGEIIPNLLDYIFIVVFVISIVRICICYKNKLVDGSEPIFKLSILLLFIFVSHIMFGLIIGTSLGHQHYIMLSSIIYLVIACSFALIENTKKKYGKVFNVVACLILLGIVFNLHTGYQDISSTKGSGYYASEINSVGNYLSLIDDDSVLICPQWGYWMGAAIASGGEKCIWNDTDVQAIVEKLNTRNYESIHIILNNAPEQLVEKIFSDTSYNKVVNSTVISAGSVESVQIIELRSEK